MVAQAVGLDDQPELGPVEVDLEAVHVLPGQRRRKSRLADDPEEAHRWELLTRTQEAMIIPPRFAAYPACEDALWRAVQRAIEGAVSPQEAVADAARQISALLDRTRASPVPNVI